MIKELLKRVISSTGHVMLTKSRFSKLEEGPSISNFDFFFLVRKMFNRNDKICCFDIGANIGQTAIKLKKYYPKATVYCFEPVKETYDALIQNAAILSEMFFINQAMGASQGEKVIFHRNHSALNSLVDKLNQFAESQGAESELVRINTVDNFCEENSIKQIHFLKTDTEGYDLEVLKGAKTSLENQVIDLLYVEVGFSLNDIEHSNWLAVNEYLTNYGYHFSGLFESVYGADLKYGYANALFVSDKRMASNKKLTN